MQRDAFSEFHPLTCFAFFALCLSVTMFCVNPLVSSVSLIAAAVYAAKVAGAVSIRRLYMFLPALFLLTALINPLFSHEGQTMLFYLPTGNAVTLESIAYGAQSALMLTASALWLFSMARVLTADKNVYLFGKAAPIFALALSMTLGFIPRFASAFNRAYRLRKSEYDACGEKIRFAKVKSALNAFSAVVTWALENSQTTSESMNSRGYGLGARTSFSLFNFERRDTAVLLLTFVCALFFAVCTALGKLKFVFFPTLHFTLRVEGAAFILLFLLYSLLPSLLHCAFVRKYKKNDKDKV